ncbi:hypothetical protein AB0K51_21000 [Kitasatospora sp. NPDC049285]|uniref:hypothetical protein n=1 Tax=Kitasatospora sp. NPDC049285 TaxID=3157096 RepID=UPI0034247847
MPNTLTRLDERLEAAAGDSLSSLAANEARADAATARLVEAHRALVAAETRVSFLRVKLINVAAARRRVDDAVLDQLDAQLEALETAADQRDQLEAELLLLIQAREAEAEQAAEREKAAASAPVRSVLVIQGAPRRR